MSDQSPTVARFHNPSPLTWIIVVAFLAFFLQGLWAADMSLDRLQRGALNLVRFLGQAMPPDFSNWYGIADAMWETLNIAIVGVTFGCLFSIPLAILAASNTSPNKIVRTVARLVIAVSRTIPDLIPKGPGGLNPFMGTNGPLHGLLGEWLKCKMTRSR